jgi:hypothetical protein
MSRMKTILFVSLPVLFSAVIGFALLEGLVRLKVGAPWEQKFPIVRVKADSEAGWRMLPNDRHYTYTQLVQLNSLGFRGPEPQEKAGDEFRVIALGGSNLYGQGLADQELMSVVLTDELNSRSSDCRISVVNMSARGYGIRSELAVLNSPGLSLDPDHVVLFFYINDYDKLDIEKVYAHYSEYDWYHWDLKGKATEERISKWRTRQFFRNSAALMWVYDVVRSFDRSYTIDQRLLQGDLNEKIRLGMANVDESLERLVALSKQHDFSISLVALPEPSQGQGEYPNERYQSKLSEDAERHAIPFFDLLPTLKALAVERRERMLIPFDGHYNADVQQQFAVSVAEDLTANHVDCNKTQASISAQSRSDSQASTAQGEPIETLYSEVRNER